MTTVDPVEELRAEVRGLSAAFKIVGGTLLFVVCALSARAAAAAPYFEGIYRDMLPGIPLPMLTQLTLGNSGLLLAVSVAILIAGLFALMMPARRAAVAIALLTIAAMFQFLATGLALFLPLITRFTLL